MSTDKEKTPNIEKDIIYRCNNIIKSPEDKREYRGIHLKNRLKVLLASDPTTDKSAAALTVRVGHLCDPDNIPGLAHFCEHMLFLGTKKYPEENMLETGGSSNAWTATDSTTFHFDIIAERFAWALDIFAQFFISPLFTISGTARELQAINSEHDKHVRNDHWRLDQLNKSTADPNHPFNNFATGNRETLEIIPKKMGIEVHQELLKFHSKWYSSNLMSLVIFGKESLDDLEKIVVNCFSEIEDKNVTLPTWPQHPYSEEYRGLQLKVVPIKDMRNMYLTFPIPDARIHYKSAPLSYISDFIGHEGPGSLLSLLKAKGWCNSLCCGSYYGARGFDMFKITVDLTEVGIKHTDDIVELVFQYINLINKKGIRKRYFNEQVKILTTAFRFKDKQDSMSFVTEYVDDIQDYPMEHVINANFHVTDWKPELIQNFLSLLTPDRIRIVIFGKMFESICNLSEKWYGTKYNLEKISEDKINRWKNCGLNRSLYLPAVNSFLPDSLDLIEPDSESKKYPTIVYDTALMRVWYKQDDTYFLPKMNTFFDFVNPIAYSDPLNCTLNTLFVLLLEDSLNEYAYAAELAGIYYDIDNTTSGFSLQIDGYDSKQHILLDSITNKLLSFHANPKRFDIVKESFIRVLKNFEAEEPYHHGFHYLSSLLSQYNWSIKEYLNVEYAITIDNFHDYIKHFFAKVHIEGFIHGNASKKKAMELATIVERKLPKTIIPLLPKQLILSREIRLEKGSHYRLEIDHTVHCCSCALVYFQCGLQSTNSNVLIEMLLHILSEPCFSILRTKEQLGYVVFSGIRRSSSSQGIRILIQSDRHPVYVESRIEAFLQYMDNYIKNMCHRDYENYRNSLIAKKLERPKTMLGRSLVFRSEILCQQYNFDRVNVEVEALRKITKDQIYDFYKDILSISSPKRKKIGVHIISSAESGAAHPDTEVIDTDNSELLPVPKDPSSMVKIEDIVAFKSGRSLFQLITPFTNIPLKGKDCKP